MSLGIKQLIPDPWADIDKKYPLILLTKPRLEISPILVYL
ncbi:MAG: hypothetical protein CM15mP65_29620 [Crocinitomicaceae bacterium]|nr:MAG: hypothetical protein CM15mP65_29620 [Crocinitomicaceae bacterium]